MNPLFSTSRSYLSFNPNVITISANNNRLFESFQVARTFLLLENNKRLYFVQHLMLVGGLINRFIVWIFIQNFRAVELRLVSHISQIPACRFVMAEIRPRVNVMKKTR
jgi:hypothetical protein